MNFLSNSRLLAVSFADVFCIMKIVLAYSGGLDTSVLLSWIKEKYNAEMIAFCANIGQEEELKGLDKKATRTLALRRSILSICRTSSRAISFSR